MPFPSRPVRRGFIGLAVIVCSTAGCYSLPTQGSPPQVIAADNSSVATLQPYVTLYVGEG